MLVVVFNELSLPDSLSGSPHEGKRMLTLLVTTLLRLKSSAGELEFRTGSPFFSLQVASGYSIGRWAKEKDAADPDTHEANLRLRLKSLATKSYFIDDPADGELAGIWNDRQRGLDARVHGTACDGLFATYLLDGIAVSLNTASIWDTDMLTLTVTELRAEGLDCRSPQVRHASTPDHAFVHSAWIAQNDPESGRASMRQRVRLKECSHTPASVYKKHVRGDSNETRRQSATQLNGDGQYLVQRLDTGETIGDAEITAWECEGLARALDGNDCEVRTHGDGFHVLIRHSWVVGYAGGSGEETDLMRIEWSSGQVHSHPR